MGPHTPPDGAACTTNTYLCMRQCAWQCAHDHQELDSWRKSSSRCEKCYVIIRTLHSWMTVLKVLILLDWWWFVGCAIFKVCIFQQLTLHREWAMNRCQYVTSVKYLNTFCFTWGLVKGCLTLKLTCRTLLVSSHPGFLCSKHLLPCVLGVPTPILFHRSFKIVLM